ncbi:MAG: efflux RND transporter permease subunit [Flavobacteriales bacterium]|nr:efflux RND transporter permease subunit [Flavobacteriales bacterium]
MSHDNGRSISDSKRFSISSWAVDNRATVMVLTILIALMGWNAYQAMPREAFPEVVTPEIFVSTFYPGNSPEDMEKLVTRPIEKELKTITGIDDILSTSVQGYSTIDVKFDFSVSPTEALRKVKDAVDKAKADPDFPTDLPAEPGVFEMNFSEMMPVMNINLSGDYSLDQLNKWAEQLEDKLENLEEVNKVEIRGVPKKELRISLDLPKMEARQVSFQDVASAVQQENVSVSGGEVLVDGLRRTVSVSGEFTDPVEVKEIIVKQENLEIVRLGEIADVAFTYVEPTSFAREFGKPVVMVDVIKRSGKNLLVLSDSVKAQLSRFQRDVLPRDLSVSITGDMSDQTRTQVDELENSIIFGVLLVVAVLMFFLGLRNAVFVGIAIPMSMLLSFIVLNSMGYTLNMMVLFSLVLALGMLVDNGIVVVENTHRLMGEGQDPVRAAKNGIGEVAWPIIASTATTVAVFIPLLMWPGIMGEFMKFLPITLMVVLASSLFVGLIVNPMLASRYMRVKQDGPPRWLTFKVGGWMTGLGLLFSLTGHFTGNTFLFTLGNLAFVFGVFGYINHYFLYPASMRFQNVLMPRIEDRYRNFLVWALQGKRPRNLFLGTIGLLIFSFMLTGIFPPNTLFFPVNEPLYVNVFIEKPIGTDIMETDATTREVERRIEAVLAKPVFNDEVIDTLPDGNTVNRLRNFMVTSVIAQVGEGTSDPMSGPSFDATPHKGRVQVTFAKYAERRGLRSMHLMQEIREAVRGVPGVTLIVDKDPAGPPVPKAINLEIKGDDVLALIAEGEKVRDFLKDQHIDKVEELKLDIEMGKPEMPIEIDRAKARRYNVSTWAIGDALRTGLYGREVSTYKQGEDDYPVNIRLKDEYRYDPEQLLGMRVTFRDQTNGQIRQVPISALATPRYTSTYSAVKRKDLKRMVQVHSNVTDEFAKEQVVNNVIAAFEAYPKDPRFTYEFTGELKEQAKEMTFLSTALLIAVFLVFMIIVAQFNSAAIPAIIVSSVVFSLIGVFLGLVIFRMEFVIMMTMVGIISLAGIVVNNAIVLVDFMLLLQNRRKAELGLRPDQRLPMAEVLKTIEDAGARRLRPVLLTAITTVLGLIPLAIGININFFTLFSQLDAQFVLGGDNTIFWGPMSWTVIFGLVFATFLTLVIVPMMFLLLTKVLYRWVPVREMTTSGNGGKVEPVTVQA